MKKFSLIFLLVLFCGFAFAVCSYCAEYEMVMFKCGIKGGKTIEPNISESLSKIGLNATYEYDGEKAYVFAIVKNDINLTWLAVTNLLMPLSKEEEEKFKETIEARRKDALCANDPTLCEPMKVWQ
jgi:hypothetical protein